MLESVDSFLTALGPERMPLLLVGLGAGCMVGLVGLYGTFSGPEPTSRRFRPTTPAASGRPDAPIVKDRERDPSSVMKALVPSNRSQRTQVRRDLAHAGFSGKDAVLNFYLVRALLGIALPSVVLAIMFLNPIVPMPHAVAWVADLSRFKTFQLLTILGAIGFYGPVYWLGARSSKRKLAISSGFPNALDLLQISSEAGLGFDAAISRVSEEIAKVSPEIAEEFAIAQSEILAGRDRDKALLEMADRMGIDEAFSFANVILQSKKFGTNVSEALLTYSDEMRTRRELKAQEKANRLPVQMSAVMASLMLPALFMIALTPVVIRYVRYFAAH